MADNGIEQQRIDAALEKARSFLRSEQMESGAWSYKSGQSDPSLEATSWASLALAGETDRIERVVKFFVNQQKEDGGFSTAPQVDKSSWVTGPVLLAMRLLHKDVKDPLLFKEVDKSVEKALTFLCDTRVEFYPAVARLLLLLSKGTEGVKYARGWPWDKHCYHWVEPTSYNLLALKTAGIPDSHKGYFAEIVDIAEKFLLEHPCKTGGWNHGNDRTLGADLPPYRVTTAEALLAIQEFRGRKPVESGLNYLSSLSDQDTSSMSLAWSSLALNAYGLDNSKETEYLLNRQKPDGSFGDNRMVDGLACLALNSKKHNLLKYE